MLITIFILKLILYLYLLCVIVTSSIIYSSFIYLYFNTKEEYKFYIWLKKIIYECWLVNLKYLFLPLRFSLKYLPNNKSPTGTGIVLIHGYSRDQNDWRWFLKHLKKLNVPIIAVNLPTLSANAEELVHKLQTSLVVAEKNYSIHQWILIGHSLVGIIATYYAQQYPSKVQKIVTLGSPFFGTKLAYYGCSDNIQQLCPGSKFLTKLNHNMTNVPIYNVASKLDNMIIPWRSALIHNAKAHLILDCMSHQELLYNSDIIKKILVWLS